MAVFPAKPERQTFQSGGECRRRSHGHRLGRISRHCCFSDYTFGPFPEASLLSGAERKPKYFLERNQRMYLVRLLKN